MRLSFFPLRVVLGIVAAANLFTAYLFFFTPVFISELYGLPEANDLQQFLTMTIGALIGVFGVGALLPLARPLKYGAIIIMLLLMHFCIFLIDVVVLSRGMMDWKWIIPEMVYFLVVSTALVRWYPLKIKEKEGIKGIQEKEQ